MKKLFNRSFFKFTVGFIGIILVALAGIFLVQFLEIEAQAQTGSVVGSGANN